MPIWFNRIWERDPVKRVTFHSHYQLRIVWALSQKSIWITICMDHYAMVELRRVVHEMLLYFAHHHQSYVTLHRLHHWKYACVCQKQIILFE